MEIPLTSRKNWDFGQFTEKAADETLFLELALRGYDLSRLRENEENETTKLDKVYVWHKDIENRLPRKEK